jgi:sucrose-6-phosphate hydrolase SacC (GH32 family)
VGAFDGCCFRTEGPHQRFDWGGTSYAAQSFSDVPADDGRRIQIAWLRAEFPGMPFNQQMSFPCELTLRTTEEGIRLHAEPVREIESLVAREHAWSGEALSEGAGVLSGVEGDLFDIEAEIELGDATEVSLDARGLPVVYNVEEKELACGKAKATVAPVDGKLRLRVLVDRASVEVFAQNGRYMLPVGTVLDAANRSLALRAKGAGARAVELRVRELKPAWTAG